jgi:uncharacterized protein YegP (UPF0339 family)
MRPFAKTMMLPALLVAAIAVGGLSVAPGQDKKKDDKATVIFEVYKDRSDEFRFRLKDGEHSLAIAPKGYKTKDDVLKVIDEIKKEAAKAKVVDDTTKK